MKQFKQMVARSERGQAIVLIALFMVVMLAMVGVAIDGGGLFWLWRNAQNAADSAALQAAFDRCTGASGTTWQQVGYDAAEVNGFDNNGMDNWVVVDDNGGTDYTRVEITAHKPKYFIQLVYTGTLEVKAEAIVYCTRAIDFSNLPGAIGLGDCSCPANIPPSNFTGGQNSVDMAGSNQTIIGGMRSNCDFDVTGSTSNWTDGGPQASNEVDINSDATGDASEPAQPGIEADPLSLSIAMYMPGGVIYQQILATSGKAYFVDVDDSDSGLDSSYTGGTNQNIWNPGAGSCSGDLCDAASGLQIPVEGLFYVDGNVDLSWLDADEWYGGTGDDDSQWNGITVVASGSITMPDPNQVTWRYYGYNFEETDDAGVAAEFSNGQWPFLLAFSNYNNNQSPCNVNASSAALNLGGQDMDDTLDLLGVLYAPLGYLHWSGNHKQGRGAIVVLKIDWQGSDTAWEFDPDVLPPRAPTMNNVQ